MSKLTSASRTVTLGDTDIKLVATLGAMTGISRYFGGLQPALQQISALNAEAIIEILAQASGMRDRRSREVLGEAVFTGGIGEASVHAVRYVSCLMAGGKWDDDPTEDAPEDDKKKAGE